jgi:hypothetical protein
MVFSACAVLIVIDDSEETDAATVSWEKFKAGTYKWKITVNTYVGENWSVHVPISKAQEINSGINAFDNVIWVPTSNPPVSCPVTLTNNGDGSFTISGINNTPGIYDYSDLGQGFIKGNYLPKDTAFNTFKQVDFFLKVVVSDVYTIQFDAQNGTYYNPIVRGPGQEYGALPTPIKSGYEFGGWYYTEGDGSVTGPVGSNWTAFMNLTLWAKWTLIEIPIEYTDPSGNLAANVSWSHQMSDTSGVSMTISGENTDWLNVSGGRIYGIPPAAGEYEVTVTLSSPNATTVSTTFTLHVMPQLVPTNSPLSGAIIFV